MESFSSMNVLYTPEPSDYEIRNMFVIPEANGEESEYLGESLVMKFVVIIKSFNYRH